MENLVPITLSVEQVYKRGYKIPPGYEAEFRLLKAGDTYLDAYDNSLMLCSAEPRFGYARIVVTKRKFKLITFHELPYPNNPEVGSYYEVGENLYKIFQPFDNSKFKLKLFSRTESVE